MARKSTKKLDLSTAKQADGQLRAPTSVYEIIGIPTSSYGSKTLEQYQREIEAMDLYSLQAHAQSLGVLPNSHRTILLDRLEKKFIVETARYSSAVAHGGKSIDTASEEARRDAQKIIGRGR